MEIISGDVNNCLEKLYSEFPIICIKSPP